jgi:UDP-4-amino-4-deoxy-L-arabinose formyltransferase/UDP-glucuronic acid dehydrogenase (UDP-4-keto-hexauronic acid decarboxylating)
MKVAIIGRTKMLYDCIDKIIEAGHSIPLIITSKAAPDYDISEDDFRNIASKIGAKFIYTPKINETEIINAIRSIGEIDIAISINYTGVISKEVIGLFREGILNAHGGDLPKYRGNACQAWAIINGEKEIGLCIHKMIGGELDSGDIIEKKLYPITINTRIGEVYDWFKKDIPEMMLSAILKINSGNKNIFVKQSVDSNDALRCYPRLPEDGKITWGQSAENIIRLINASSEPYDGAFAFFENEKIIIWRAELYKDFENYLAIPGQIAAIKDEGIVMITGSGKILITLVEIRNLKSNPSNKFKSIRKRFD